MSSFRGYVNIRKLTLLFFLPVFLFGLAKAAFNTYLSDSEIWSISLARFFWSPLAEGSGIALKPLFYLLITPAQLISDDNYSIFLWARFLAFVSTLTTLYFSFRILLVVTKDKYLALFFILAILSSYQFLAWFPTVRSDAFAMVAVLAGVYEIVKGNGKVNGKQLLLTQLVALSITPKTIFFVACQWIIIGYFRLRLNWVGKNYPLYLVAPLIFSVIVFQFTALGESFVYTWKSLFAYWRASTNGEELYLKYFSAKSFYYLFRFVLDDFVIAVGAIAAIILFPFIGMAKDNESIVWAFGTLTVLLLIAYPTKLPFFISSTVPILVITIAGAYRKLRDRIKVNVFSRLGGGLGEALKFASVFVVVMISYFGHLRGLHFVDEKFNNRTQLDTIAFLETHLPAELSCYDGILLFPKGRCRLGYLGPGQDQVNQQTIREIEENPPDIILGTGRVMITDAKFRLWILLRYTDLGQGIFLLNGKHTSQVEAKLSLASEKLDQNLASLFQFNMGY